MSDPTFLGALRNLGTGLYRATAKFAGYDAARQSPTNRTGSRIGTNPNSTFSSLQRVGMQFTAEDVVKNSCIGQAYLAVRQNFCSSQLTYVPNTGDAGLDRAIKSYLHGESGYGGKFGSMGFDCSMQDAFSRTADIETPVRGDAGLIWWRDAYDDLRLIEFSADQLGEIYSFTRPRKCGLVTIKTGPNEEDSEIQECAGDGFTYFAGRYFQGADCVAYKIYERTDSWYGNPVIYPAHRVMYFRDPASFRGLRGVSIFATVMQHMENGEQLFLTGMQAARRQAKTAMIVKNANGAPDEGSYETDIDLLGRVTYREAINEGPQVEYFYDGDEANFASPDSPGPELIQGVETSDERVAVGLRLTYAFLMSSKNLNGAPMRQDTSKVSKEFKRIQNNIHRPKLHQISDRLIMDAANKGIFPLVPHIKRGHWQLPIDPIVDAFYEAKENIANIRAGLECPQDIISETNRDPDEVLTKTRQWAVSVAMAVEDANRELVDKKYKPTVTIANISQDTDNPQQQPAEQAPEQSEKPTAQLSNFDESKISRDDDGKFGSGSGSSKGDEKTIDIPAGNPDAESDSPDYIKTIDAVKYARKALGKDFSELVKNRPGGDSEDQMILSATIEDVARDAIRASQKGEDPIAAIEKENAARWESINRTRKRAGLPGVGPLAGKLVAQLKDFDESKISRDDDGKFGSGGGGAKKKDESPSKKSKPTRAKSDFKKPEVKPAISKPKELSEKAQKAKAAHVMVDAGIQRYAEEYAEPKIAKELDGVSFPNSEPVDIVIGKDGVVTDGVELKTMVLGANDKLTMNSYAQVRKIEWERANKSTYHTVVADDRNVYSADGNHDESKRVYYYRRGVAGSARIGSMQKVESLDELKKLMAMNEKSLPDAAKRTDGKLRVGRWKEFRDEKGKGFRNSKTGVEFRAKK